MINIRPARAAKTILKREPFKPKDGPNQIDIVVGKNIRNLRNKLGITQESLAEMISVTFQQVQKYESGQNRVSASRLLIIALSLGVTPNDLFVGEI